MTRAKRYANYKGGRKYDAESGTQKEKSAGHQGQDEKLESSNIFKGYWERCREYSAYLKLKEEFQKEQKEWDKTHPKLVDRLTGQVAKRPGSGDRKQTKSEVKSEGGVKSEEGIKTEEDSP